MHLKELDKSIVASPDDTAEKAQVRETYVRHDRELSNPPSRRLFEAQQPELDDRQRKVVDALHSDGYCLLPFTELFSEAIWQELYNDAEQFTREIEAQLAGRTEPKKAKLSRKPKREKAFMGRRFKRIPPPLDNPWVRLGGSSRMLDIVNTYLGMWTKLSYVDQWYSPPRGSEADRLGSMRWHRDYNDQHLVKVFVYLVDVDEGTGPLEYVPGSAAHGPYVGEWSWQPLGESYPSQEEFEQRIPDSEVKTFTGPKGSLIFCNTSGFHRGGYATERSRNVFVYNYVSPAALMALVERNFEIPASATEDLPDVERFALT
jgi:hypothetical protein